MERIHPIITHLLESLVLLIVHLVMSLLKSNVPLLFLSLLLLPLLLPLPETMSLPVGSPNNNWMIWWTVSLHLRIMNYYLLWMREWRRRQWRVRFWIPFPLALSLLLMLRTLLALYPFHSFILLFSFTLSHSFIILLVICNLIGG